MVFPCKANERGHILPGVAPSAAAAAAVSGEMRFCQTPGPGPTIGEPCLRGGGGRTRLWLILI